MASAVSSPVGHSFPSLVVNRTRVPSFQPRSSPGLHAMPLQEVIVISDDEATNNTTKKGKTPVLQRYRDPERSTTDRRHFKRQRLDEHVDLTSQPSASGTRDAIKGESIGSLDLDDDDFFTNALVDPDFFGDAFGGGQYLDVLHAATPSPPVEVPSLEEVKPPFFHDPKLQILMFCGPGFEHFPVPMITDAQHQDFCDRWCARQKRREDRQLTKGVLSNAVPFTPTHEGDSEEDVSDLNLTKGEADCLARVLEILPDAQRALVISKIRTQHESYDFGGEEIEVLPDIGTVVAEILEIDNYPKEDLKEKRTRDPFEEETGKTISWNSKHRSDKSYLSDALIVLAATFEYVPSHYIHKIVSEKKTLWDAYVYIEDAESDYFQLVKRPYKRLGKSRGMLEKKYQRSIPAEPHYYAAIITELQAAKQHVAREFLRKNEDQQKREAEIANLEFHKAQGAILECQCCFDDEVPLNRAVACTGLTDAHNFCYACVENLANTQIGLMRHEMLCMDGSGCKKKLDMDGVGQAIPIKTYDRLLFNEQQAEIVAANIEGLEHCPFCDFMAICEPVEVDTTFGCQNPDCFRVTCRKCHEISHLPKTCEEMQKDRGLNAKHKIEEARSAAMLRPCPKCKTNIIKESGCNKMRCPCGAIMCYVCKADLSQLRDGYFHFDGRAPGSGHKGKKCQLYDSYGVDRHIVEANEAEAKAIQEIKATDDTLEMTDLQIETGRSANEAKYAGAAQLLLPGVLHQRIPDHAVDGQPRVRHAHGLPARPQQNRVGRRAARAARVGQRSLPALEALPPAFQGLAAQDANGMAIEGWRNQIPAAQQQIPGNTQEAIFHRQYDLPMELDDPLNANPEHGKDACEVENFIAGHRISDHRTDMDPRRRFQFQRRNSTREGDNTPLTYPNPAYLNIRHPLLPEVAAVDQQRPQPTPSTQLDAHVPAYTGQIAPAQALWTIRQHHLQPSGGPWNALNARTPNPGLWHHLPPAAWGDHQFLTGTPLFDPNTNSVPNPLPNFNFRQNDDAVADPIGRSHPPRRQTMPQQDHWK